MKSITQQLLQKSNDSSSEGQLATFLLNCSLEEYDLKVREIAERVYVSNATCTRLAQSLGFSGFNELRFELKREKLEIKDHNNVYRDSKIDTYLTRNVNTLIDTTNTMDYQVISKLVTDIEACNKVVIFAIGSTLLRAMDFEYKLRRLGIDVITSMDFDQQLAQSKTLKPNDVAIGVSYSGATSVVNKCLKNSIEQTENVYFVSSVNEPEIKGIKHIKLARSEPVGRFYSISSLTSINYVLDLVFLELVASNPTKYEPLLKSTKANY